MSHIHYTLVTDGSSDRLLKYPIDWLLNRLTPHDFDGRWANPAVFRNRKTPPSLDRIDDALEYYPCQLLFVHRDAERGPREVRVDEIRAAIRQLTSAPPAVCLVPVRMTEAWLLIDKQALREAAGNPNGRVDLGLPPTSALESLADPKKTLFDLLKKASELKGRSLRGFREGQARQRIAELIDDFSPLDELPAFRDFRAELKDVLTQNGWA